MHKYEKIPSFDPDRYETWKLSHNCSLNYTDSSPGMETRGATRIFKRSIYNIAASKVQSFEFVGKLREKKRLLKIALICY